MRKAIRKISSLGKYSKILILPREFLKKLKWREKQNVEVKLDEKNQRLIIKDARNK